MRKSILMVAVIAVVAVVAVAVYMFLGQQNKQVPGYCVINYEGSWNGTITYDEETHKFGGVGLKAIRLPSDVDSVSATIQKRDSLNVQIELLLVSDLDEDNLTWKSSDVIVSDVDNSVVTVEWES